MQISTQQLHISLALATHLAAAAIEAAEAANLQIACVVVDNNGRCRTLSVMDGAPVVADEMALQKARTALLGLPSGEMGQAMLADTAAFHSFVKQASVNFLGGGLPIVHQGETLGAIGVGGAMPEQDAACAEAAIALLDAL